ncbi:hypothetical protein [Pelotomaculum sp. FP]|nr:hypothetical protein [Pelotomaculum sp. FP]
MQSLYNNKVRLGYAINGIIVTGSALTELFVLQAGDAAGHDSG